MIFLPWVGPTEPQNFVNIRIDQYLMFFGFFFTFTKKAIVSTNCKENFVIIN